VVGVGTTSLGFFECVSSALAVTRFNRTVVVYGALAFEGTSDGTRSCSVTMYSLIFGSRVVQYMGVDGLPINDRIDP